MNEKLFQICLDKYMGLENRSFDTIAEDEGLIIETGAPMSGAKLNQMFQNEYTRRRYPRKKDGDFEEFFEDYVRGTIEDYQSTFTLKGDGEVYSEKLLTLAQIEHKTPEDMLTAHGLDSKQFVVIKVVNEFKKVQDGRYKSTMYAKPRETQGLSLADVDEYFKTQPMYDYDKPEFVPTEASAYLNTWEFCFADDHIGKQNFDNPSENYGDVFREMVVDAYMRMDGQEVGKIIISIMGDTFHTDTAGNTTTAGTNIHHNGSLPKDNFDLAVDLYTWAINLFASKAPVEIIHVPGNHDKLTGYMLIKTLEAYFFANDRVLVDVTHDPHKARLVGRTLVVWSHGNVSKKNLESIPMVLFRKEWGLAEFARFHLGHLHHQTAREVNGMKVVRVASPSATDEWHNAKGFVGARRGINYFVYDQQKGCISEGFVPAG
jgi:hypothetical protein